MSIEIVILANLIVLIASISQGATGMGFSLISAPFLIIVDPVFVPAPLLFTSLIISSFVFFREYKNVDFRGLKFSLFGGVLGIVLSLGILCALSKSLFSIVFACLIIIAVLVSLFNRDIKHTVTNLLLAGFFSGIMGTITSIGGPPMGLIYQNKEGAIVRATLSAFFTIGITSSLIGLFFIGKCKMQEFDLFLCILPGMLVGLALYKYFAKILDKGYTKPTILIISAVSAIVIVLKAVFL